MWRMLFMVLMVVEMGPSEGARVELDDYYGDVRFQEGVPQSLSCFVEDPEEFGVIAWRVGDRKLDPRECLDGNGCLSLPEENEDQDYENEIHQSITYIPRFEDDGREVSCEYGVPGEQLHSDSFRVLIFQQKFQVESPEHVMEGDRLVLQVTAILYPAPIEKDFTWKVENEKTTVLELHPGQKDEYGRYQAPTIQEVGHHRYKMELLIPSLTAALAGYKHSLIITSDQTATRTLHLHTPFTPQNPNIPPSSRDTKDQDDVKLSQNIKNHGSEGLDDGDKSEEPEVAMSGLGMAIIVGLLVFCIIICIIFCIVRKRRKQRQREAKDGRGAFKIVPTTVKPGGKVPSAQQV